MRSPAVLSRAQLNPPCWLLASTRSLSTTLIDHLPALTLLSCSNRDKYLLTQDDQSLINGPCLSAMSCRQEAGMNYAGGDMPGGMAGATVSVPTPKDCCTACQNVPTCGAYVYDPVASICYFKNSAGWVRTPMDNVLSGVVYDAGSDTPRDTTGGGGSPPPVGSSPPQKQHSPPPASVPQPPLPPGVAPLPVLPPPPHSAAQHSHGLGGATAWGLAAALALVGWALVGMPAQLL